MKPESCMGCRDIGIKASELPCCQCAYLTGSGSGNGVKYEPSGNDNVNSPKHYQLWEGVEVIDVRRALLKKMDGNYLANEIDNWSRSWEYLTRFMDKNGIEDLKKAKVYLDWLIRDLEERGEDDVCMRSW